ncbi:DUF1642 domain-containing protein [Lactiplantibacillus plantarum]|uniref:DUF1642 domain-containing protein n=1 Tax=Lactiplantibacillus plantarum TaxID=1590 RepID=UPI000977D663|nr:DUF1642 domain-containing protein [Lactiplantibacillus plantarum]
MIKAYLKRPVCVERIDELGTGLLDKYEIYSLSGGMWHPHDEVGHSMLCSGYLEWGDWIATGADGSHWIIQNALYEQQYAELPVIPKAVADWIKKCKKNTVSIGGAMNEPDLPEKVADYFRKYYTREQWIEIQDTFARAWLDGYRVEEGK